MNSNILPAEPKTRILKESFFNIESTIKLILMCGIFCLLIFLFTGCSGFKKYQKAKQEKAERRQIEQEIVNIIIAGVRNNDSCSSLCMKMKMFVAARLQSLK